ncbi:MAG: hypothetical protein A2W25_04970 [candidate division Zixibacteria bacterium RBG_16_53_22]|nr:MAG: hypothetical protein A2W25_04970 [candidate division Zixibacteria bacterium RBG_16_53_22]
MRRRAWRLTRKPLLLLFLWLSTASAGLIFDNGSGGQNDTLVIQFCMVDSTGRGYIDWDTAYVVQAFGGVDFNVDTLTTATSHDISGIYPRNLMFEYRLKASDSFGDTGVYTWWAYLIETTGGDVKQMHKGWYYVSDDSLPNSRAARIDSIRWAIGMPAYDSTEKYQDNLHRKLGAYSGLAGDNNNIRDDIAALSLTGSGSEACTLFVTQDSLGPIFGARLQIRTLDQTATRVPGLFTDINGRGIAELDAGGYFVAITANNYAPYTDTLVVGRDSTWTLSMAPFDPGDPPSPDLCRVYGWVYDITGQRLEGVTVSAEIPAEYHPVKYGNVVITPFERDATSDSDGYWEIDLFPNVVLSDTSSKYLITMEYPSGVILRSETAVPDSVWWQFRTED